MILPRVRIGSVTEDTSGSAPDVARVEIKWPLRLCSLL
jgi:hypothetical protein